VHSTACTNVAENKSDPVRKSPGIILFILKLVIFIPQID
jgi:hypothetical protein